MMEEQDVTRVEADDATARVTARNDGLLDRIDVIEAQPLADRAARYDQLAEELLTELQRSDHEAADTPR